MKQDIKSANLLRYNANTSGISSPDCVKRGISYAFDKSYVQVSKDLNALAEGLDIKPHILVKMIEDELGSSFSFLES